MIDLVVEDGNGITNANSYASPGQVSQVAAWKRDTHWDLAEETTQDAALIAATRYLDALYGDLYRGQLLTQTQGLLWPRTEFTGASTREYPAGTMPPQLIDATAMLAISHLASPLSLETDPDSNVRRRSVNVGSGAVSETIEFWDRGDNTNEPRAIKLTLREIIRDGSGAQYGSAIRG